MKPKSTYPTLLKLTLLALIAVLAAAQSPGARAADWTAIDENDLNAAILAANLAGAGEHTITLTADITLTAPLAAFSNTEATNITLDGAGYTLDADGTGTALVIQANTTVTLKNITITGGAGSSFPDGQSGGGIANRGRLTIIHSTITGNSAGNGGGIVNYGDALVTPSLLLEGVTLSENEAAGFGGGLYNNANGGTAGVIITGTTFDSNTTADSGGGIANHGLTGTATVEMTESTLTGNGALNGGGIFNNGNSGAATVTLGGVTLSGNNAGLQGGGIFNNGNLGVATVSLVNSTVSGNAADFQGGGIFNNPNGGTVEVSLTFATVAGNSAPQGGGLVNQSGGTVTLAATIVNAGERGTACLAGDGAGFTSDGYNIDDDDSCGLAGTGDISGGDAMLEPLALNAPGTTATHAIGDESDAQSRVPAGMFGCGEAVTIDQRGAPRPAPEPLCDIGAYESAYGEEPPPPDCEPPYLPATEAALNEAIACVNNAGPGSHTITLADDIVLSAATTPLDNAEAMEIVLDGDGHTLDGDLSGTTLTIQPNTAVRVTALTITGGMGTSGPASNWGGGIYNRGVLTLENSTITGSTAERGGGIVNHGDGVTAVLIIRASTLSGNLASDAGGAIFNTANGEGFAQLTVTNTTLSGNSAGAGGGLFNESAGGDASATFAFATLAGNSATNGGGALHTVVVTDDEDLRQAEQRMTQPEIREPGMSSVTLTATIVAGDPVVGDPAAGAACANPGGTIVSTGYNLDSDDSCHLTQSSDRPAANADLLPLALNAPGTTATHALGNDSVARDRVPAGTAGCGTTIATDQRGEPRPQPAGGKCDAGAYEARPQKFLLYMPITTSGSAPAAAKS